MTIEIDYDCTISDMDIMDPYRTRDMMYEIREARNYFGLHGYIHWVEKAVIPQQKAHGVFPRELLGNMPFLSRLFYKKLPQQGKYMFVENDKIHLVVVCDKSDMKKFRGNTQSVVSLFVAFLGVYNEKTGVAHAVVNENNTLLGQSVIAKCSTKVIGGQAVIVNTFYPITQKLLEDNNLQFPVEEQLETIGMDDISEDFSFIHKN
jgi:hypothetical protein